MGQLLDKITSILSLRIKLTRPVFNLQRLRAQLACDSNTAGTTTSVALGVSRRGLHLATSRTLLQLSFQVRLGVRCLQTTPRSVESFAVEADSINNLSAAEHLKQAVPLTGRAPCRSQFTKRTKRLLAVPRFPKVGLRTQAA